MTEASRIATNGPTDLMIADAQAALFSITGFEVSATTMKEVLEAALSTPPSAERGGCDVCGAEPGRCMTTTICAQTRENRTQSSTRAFNVNAGTPDVYRWVEQAVKFMRAFKPKNLDADLRDQRDELLQGVPVPPEDLGFNSPADRYARAWKQLHETDFSKPQSANAAIAQVPVRELKKLTIECCTSSVEPTVEELELKLDTIRDWAERFIPARATDRTTK